MEPGFVVRPGTIIEFYQFLKTVHIEWQMGFSLYSLNDMSTCKIRRSSQLGNTQSDNRGSYTYMTVLNVNFFLSHFISIRICSAGICLFCQRL